MPCGPYASRLDERAAEWVVGIVHPIAAEDRLQTVLVKRLVVGHQREPLQAWRYLCPDFRENGSLARVALREPVHLAAPEVVVLRHRLDERVEGVCHHAVAHDDHAHRAYACGLRVGCLKIYCCKVFHCLHGFCHANIAHHSIICLRRDVFFREEDKKQADCKPFSSFIITFARQ